MATTKGTERVRSGLFVLPLQLRHVKKAMRAMGIESKSAGENCVSEDGGITHAQPIPVVPAA